MFGNQIYYKMNKIDQSEYYQQRKQKLTSPEYMTQMIWKEKCDKVYFLNSQNEEITIPHLIDILDLLYILNQEPDHLSICGSEEMHKYLMGEYFFHIVKNLIFNKYFRLPEALEISNNILYYAVFLFLNTIKTDNIKLAECFVTVLDPSRIYFKTNNQVPGTYNANAFRTLTTQQEEWHNSLKLGDQVDAVKLVKILNTSLMNWSRAIVVQGDSGLHEDLIQISFIGDLNIQDRTLPRNSYELSILGSKTTDWDWRLNLQPGDQVDCCDNSDLWYKSTILETSSMESDGKTIKIIKIGYRIYLESGNRLDKDGKAFMGWSSKYDEEMPVTNIRIQPLHTYSKSYYVDNSVMKNEPVLNDANDVLHCVPGQVTYAVIRPGNVNNIFLVNLLNAIGETGGFDKILERISDKTNWCPLHLISKYLQALGNIQCLLHHDYILSFIPRLKEALEVSLITCPPQNIRNFGKDDLLKIFQNFSEILRRNFSIGDKNDIINKYKLQIALNCFNSQFLEKKISGLKTIIDIMKDAKNSSDSSLINVQVMRKCVEENDIFNKLYAQKDSFQLIQRSGDFLVFLISENLLSLEDLQLLWRGSLIGDSETKLAIYKCLKDVSAHFKEQHLNFIVDKIIDFEASQITTDEVDLLHELTKYCSINGKEFQLKISNFFWKLICQSQEAQAEIVETSIDKFCYIMRDFNMRDGRKQVIADCCANIQKNQSVLPSLQVIKQIIDGLNTQISSFDGFTKQVALQDLYSEIKIVNLIVRNIQEFKANNVFYEMGEAQMEKDKSNLSYKDHIQKRVQFIDFVYSQLKGKYSPDFSFLTTLWDELVKNCLSNQEKDIMYVWFGNITSPTSQIKVAKPDLNKFFSEFMCNAIEIQHMTAEGFKCFGRILCVINEQQERLRKKEQKKPQNQQRIFNNPYIGYGPMMQNQAQQPQEDTQKKQEEEQWKFDYIVLADPNKFNGIDELWGVVFENNNDEVISLALEFLNKLYTSLSASLVNIQQDLKHQYLRKVYEFTIEVINKNEGEGKIRRALNIFNSIIGESERKGSGGLKSLVSLVRGEMLQLNFVNDYIQGVNIPNAFSLKVDSNLTVYELLFKISLKVKITYDEVGLMISESKRYFTDKDNGKTLSELRIRNNEIFLISKLEIPPIEKAELLDSDGNVNPQVIKIFKNWFKQFSKEGKMDPEGCAAFIRSCTGDKCTADDTRIKNLYAIWDTDKDNILVEENFLEFYMNSCKPERQGVVWANLHSHHYRNDLKRFDEIGLEQVDANLLPRYIIVRDSDFFLTIYNLLESSPSIQEGTWELLQRLPISPTIYDKIVQLDGIRGCEKHDWENILPSSANYKLLYCLHVIEYLLECSINTQQESLFQSEESLKLRQNWRNDFIIFGGFDHLWNIYQQITEDCKAQIPNLNQIKKMIYGFLLKIFKNYLVATLASQQEEGLYTKISIMNCLDIPTNIISQYLKENDLCQLKLIRKMSSTIINENDELLEENKKQIKEMKNQLSGIKESDEFISLKNCLEGDLGKQILSKYGDFKDFIKNTYQFNNQYLSVWKEKDLQREDRNIIQNSTLIIGAIFLSHPELIEYCFQEVPQSQELFLNGLFSKQSQNIRNLFSHVYFVLCYEAMIHQQLMPIIKTIEILMKNMPTSNDPSLSNCTQYFDLLCALIDVSEDIKEEEKIINYSQLTDQIMENIKNHKSTEERINIVNDKIQIGLLNLCDRILVIYPGLKNEIGKKNFVMEIFSKCLFDVSTNLDETLNLQEYDQTVVKCKGQDSRNAAYKLMFQLCRNSPQNLQTLIQNGLMPLMAKIPTQPAAKYSSMVEFRSPYGYCGIRNLGCICYMNAMLQQLFMVPSFRNGILMANDNQEPNMVRKNLREFDDNFFHQFQKLFSFLRWSDRQDYNPTDFCSSFKDWEGNGMNLSVQQDAQEFLNMLFDKLENSLKSTPQKNFVQSIFQGKTSVSMQCKKCGVRKFRLENFYCMTMDVKQSNSLNESFNNWCSGEVINDYQCDTCNAKVDIEKRQLIGELPNILILQLQRIVFDLDQMQQIKLNKYLEFPQEFNIEPFTQEGILWREKQTEQDKEKLSKMENISDPYLNKLPQYYDYKLAGVVVHVGSADFGHYFSYINTLRGENEFLSNTNEKWLEYNDSKISPFSTEELEQECFGNLSDSQPSMSDAWGWGNMGKDSSKNAYLLIYERKLKNPIKFNFKNEESVQEFFNPQNIPYEIVRKAEEKASEEATQVNSREEKEQVLEVSIQKKEPEELEVDVNFYKFNTQQYNDALYKQVWEDNQQFMFERHLYTDEFYMFIKEITSSVELPNLTPENFENRFYKHEIDQETRKIFIQTIDIQKRMIEDLLTRQMGSKYIEEMIFRLKLLLAVSPQYSYEFVEKFILLGNAYQNFIANLLTSYEYQIRQFVSNIAVESTIIAINFNEFDLNTDKFMNPQLVATEALVKEKKIIDYLMCTLQLMNTEVPKNWQNFRQYFEFWLEFAKGGKTCLRFLFRQLIIARFIDFFLDKESPLRGMHQKIVQMGNRFMNPYFEPLIQTLIVALRSSKLKAVHPNQKTGPLYELTNLDKRCLYNYNFWIKLIRENYSSNTFQELINLVAHENEYLSEIIINAILKGFYRLQVDECKNYIEAASYLMLIEDSYQKQRINQIMGVPTLVLKKVNTLESFGLYRVTSLEDQIYSYPTTLRMQNIGSQSFLDMLLAQLKNTPDISMMCCRYMLICCQQSQAVYNYVQDLPSPTVQFSKFWEFLGPVFKEYSESSNNQDYYSSYSFPKEEVAKETEQCYQELQSRFKQNEIQTHYLIGQNIDRQLIKQLIQVIPDNENVVRKQQKSELVINEYEYTVFVMEPKNDLINSESLQYYVNNTNKINASSELTCFLSTRNIYDPIQGAYLLWNKEGRGYTVSEYRQKKQVGQGSVNDIDEQELQDFEDNFNQGQKEQISETISKAAQLKTTTRSESCIRAFIAENHSPYHLHVKLNLTFKSNKNIFQIIETPISVLVKPQQIVYLAIINKKDLGLEWDQYEWDVTFDTLFKYNDYVISLPEWSCADPSEFEKDILDQNVNVIYRNYK